MRTLARTIIVFSLLLFGTDVPAADHLYGTVSGWGQLIDPDGDCSFTIAKDQLRVTIGEAMHTLDAEKERMNSPRVAQSLEGPFSIEVTVDSLPKLPDPAPPGGVFFVSGGLSILKNSGTYVRLERASFLRGQSTWHYVVFELRQDGRDIRNAQFVDFPLDKEKPVQLRLEMKDGVVRGLVRYPDEGWKEMGTARFPDAGTVSAGVQALNTSGQEIEVTFHNFRHNAGVSAAEAESSVGIDLKGPQQIAERPLTSSPDFREFVNKTRDLQRRSKEIKSLDASGRQKLIDDANELFVDPEDQVKMRLAMATLSILSDEFQAAADHDSAVNIFERVIESMTNAKDETVLKFGEQLKNFRDRLRVKLSMIGKPLELEGETLAGEAFDWQSYRGKVVLVDFWASWCGPCRREIPNVLEQHKKYRELGFEVVGVCLDTDRDKAEKYIVDEEIPWPSLFVKDGGWKHPMATKYHVTSIPTAILVDRDGNVVSLSARGDKLPELLVDLLGRSVAVGRAID